MSTNPQPPPTGDDWLTLAQAAAFLGLAPQTVGYHIKQGHLAARKLGPVWMIHTSALREFIRSQWHGAGRPRKAGGADRADRAGGAGAAE